MSRLAELQMEQMLLEMRDAIALKELFVANANMEVQCRDGWSCDWNEAFYDADKKIEAIKAAIDNIHQTTETT